MLSQILLESAQRMEALVYDTCVHPRRAEETQVPAFTASIEVVFLRLRFAEKPPPTWIHFFEDCLHFFKSFTSRGAVEVQDRIDSKLDLQTGLEFQQ